MAAFSKSSSVRESYLDSNATVSSIRLQLSSLDTWIHENGTDIIEFNAHVRSLVDGLAARGETTQDLLVNAFKGYKTCTDVDFLAYITAIENAHEDGTDIMTLILLMERTSNYYKKRLVVPDNKWESKRRMLLLNSSQWRLDFKRSRSKSSLSPPKTKARAARAVAASRSRRSPKILA